MNNTTEIISEDAKARGIGMSLGIIGIVVGTIGNLLTIVVFSRNPGFQTTFNYFITNLAVFDLVTSVLVLPFSVAGFALMDWPVGASDNFSASLHAFSSICSNYTSSLCLFVITVNRLIDVYHPKAYISLFSKKRVCVIIAMLWFTAPVILLPGLAGRDAAGRPIMGWRTDEYICTFVIESGVWNTYKQITQIIFMMLPMCFMVILYCATLWRLKSVDPKMFSSGDAASTLGERNNLVTMTDLQLTEEESRLANSMKSKEKLTRQRTSSFVGLTMTLVFIALALPSVVVGFMENARRTVKPTQLVISFTILWLKSCVNPIIYFALSQTYRVQYIVALRYIWLKISCKL